MTKEYCPLYFYHILRQALIDNHPTYRLATRIDEKVIKEIETAIKLGFKVEVVE